MCKGQIITLQNAKQARKDNRQYTRGHHFYPWNAHPDTTRSGNHNCYSISRAGRAYDFCNFCSMGFVNYYQLVINVCLHSFHLPIAVLWQLSCSYSVIPYWVYASCGWGSTDNLSFIVGQTMRINILIWWKEWQLIPGFWTGYISNGLWDCYLEKGWINSVCGKKGIYMFDPSQ